MAQAVQLGPMPVVASVTPLLASQVDMPYAFAGLAGHATTAAVVNARLVRIGRHRAAFIPTWLTQPRLTEHRKPINIDHCAGLSMPSAAVSTRVAGNVSGEFLLYSAQCALRHSGWVQFQLKKVRLSLQ